MTAAVTDIAIILKAKTIIRNTQAFHLLCDPYLSAFRMRNVVT